MAAEMVLQRKNMFKKTPGAAGMMIYSSSFKEGGIWFRAVHDQGLLTVGFQPGRF